MVWVNLYVNDFIIRRENWQQQKKVTYSHLHIDFKLVSSVAKEGQENCVWVCSYGTVKLSFHKFLLYTKC